ncbi:MAG: Sel1 repeat-containing protein [Halothiobacillaceae bacterium]|nr:MAG: Sel1 repeat-containing protein [Halothiobacillaceae bacterium]
MSKRILSVGVLAGSLLFCLSGGGVLAADDAMSFELPPDVAAMEEQANKGNVEAQRNLGLEYLFGKKVTQDGLTAEQWLLAAAKAGDAAAQTALGYLYEEGIGIAKELGFIQKSNTGKHKNHDAALKLLTRAASWGDAYAQANLADMYEQGLGVKQNYALAATWYSAAAAQNHVMAQSRMGHLHEKGLGVAQDNIRAYMWYNIAGVWDTVGNTDLPASDPRFTLRKKMSPEEIATAETLATDWWVEHFTTKEPGM